MNHDLHILQATTKAALGTATTLYREDPSPANHNRLLSASTAYRHSRLASMAAAKGEGVARHVDEAIYALTDCVCVRPEGRVFVLV